MTPEQVIRERHAVTHWCVASSQAEDGGLFEGEFPEGSFGCDTALALALLDAARAAIGAFVDEAHDSSRFGEDDDTEQVGIWVARETWDALAAHREAQPARCDHTGIGLPGCPTCAAQP